jgi:CRISPR-associated protein Cas2
MARRRYLLAYDIRDPQRLQKVARCAEAFGDRVQYSVFICDLSDIELVYLKTSLEPLIERREDSIMMVDLGAEDSTRFFFMGQHMKLPDRSALIL